MFAVVLSEQGCQLFNQRSLKDYILSFILIRKLKKKSIFWNFNKAKIKRKTKIEFWSCLIMKRGLEYNVCIFTVVLGQTFICLWKLFIFDNLMQYTEDVDARTPQNLDKKAIEKFEMFTARANFEVTQNFSAEHRLR